jgi:hypothetical protein
VHKGITIGKDVELLLQLDDEDPDSCAYYFVDHATLSVFWLHEVSTQDLNLYPVTSKSHLSTCRHHRANFLHFYYFQQNWPSKNSIGTTSNFSQCTLVSIIRL